MILMEAQKRQLRNELDEDDAFEVGGGAFDFDKFMFCLGVLLMTLCGGQEIPARETWTRTMPLRRVLFG